MKDKLKPFLIGLMVLVMVITGGCGDNETDTQPVDVSSSTASDQHSDNPTTEATSETETTSGTDHILAETILYDEDGIKITATGYEEGWLGPEVLLLVENTSEKNVLVTARSVSVNGYMMSLCSVYTEVAAGKRVNDSLCVLSSELEQSGIETVSKIQLHFVVSDADSWDELAVSGLVTVDISPEVEQPVDSSGDVLHDSNGIKVICKGLKQDAPWDGNLVFYMENQSGESIAVTTENVHVNGLPRDTVLWTELRSETRAITGLSLPDQSGSDQDRIEEISFNLKIINSETWEELVSTDVITIIIE